MTTPETSERQSSGKKKALLIPAAAFGVYKAGKWLRTRQVRHRRHKVVKRVDRRQKADRRARRRAAYRARNPRRPR